MAMEKQSSVVVSVFSGEILLDSDTDNRAMVLVLKQSTYMYIY